MNIIEILVIIIKSIEQFTSVKYEIGGTLDDPDVSLVGVFDTSMKEGDVSDPE